MGTIKLPETIIKDFINYASDEDYEYMINNVDKINNIFNIFKEYNVTVGDILLFNRPDIFYETEEFIKGCLEKNKDKIDLLNDSLDYAEDIFF